MERLNRQFHIAFIGNNDNTGNSFLSLNFAYDMLSRNYKVVYTTDENDRETCKFFKSISPGKEKNSVTINTTGIEQFSIVSFSSDFDSRYSGKIEEIINNIQIQPDIVIHNIGNPLAPPFNSLLVLSDVWVITMRLEPTAASDYFGLIKKMMMLEKQPATVFVVFNHTKDIERGFEIYQKILKDSEEFDTDILPVFLGVVPGDPLRQAHSVSQGIPLRMLFSECSVSGAVSFMGDKTLRSLQKI